MTNTTTIKNGKAQFNGKDAKSFRTTMGKYYNARHTLNDETLLKNERIKSLQSVIDSNYAQIEKIKGGAVSGRTEEEILAEIKDFEAKISKEQEEFEALSNVQKKRFEDAEKLVSTDLYNAYKSAVQEDEKADEYILAIAQFLAMNGVVPGVETCNILARATGRKNSSAKQGFKTGKLTQVMTVKAWKKLFLGTLADLMCAENAFDAYKYTYVLPEKRNK